jgi:hypothetical protein
MLVGEVNVTLGGERIAVLRHARADTSGRRDRNTG